MAKIHELGIRLRRYLLFGVQMVFQEKLKGLDFTMRNNRLYKTSMGKYHGYSKTNEKHLRKIFQSLNFSTRLRLLDVGCGKGVVLKEASGFPFQKIAGIEIQPEIVQIAERNLQLLGLTEKINCICADAVEYDEYGDYNVFFFFNPFDRKTFCSVLDKLKQSRRVGEPLIIIYHNPMYASAIEDYLPGMEKNILHDTCKNYDTYIFYKNVNGLKYEGRIG